MSRSVKNFFKGFDRYAKNVNLKYKKAGSFRTSCGGIATIISFILLLSWFVIEIVDVFIDGKYETSQSSKLTDFSDG